MRKLIQLATILRFNRLTLNRVTCFRASRLGELVVSARPPGVIHAPRTDPVRVLEDMKRLAVEQLGTLPGALYRPIEQALQSPSAGVESFHHHAALLVLRQHSASQVVQFRQQIERGFDDFMGAHARAHDAALGLIDEQHLHFHLAGQRLGEILDQRYQPLLQQMNERLGILAAALHVAPGLNPVTPSRLATVFIEAFGDACLPDALAELLFHQYQQELVRVLDDLYTRINALLAAAGYLAFPVAAESARRSPMQAGRRPSPDDEQVAPRFTAPATSAPETPQVRVAAAGPAQSTPLPRTPDQLAGLRAQLHAWRNGAQHGESQQGIPQRCMLPGRELRVQEVVSIASLLQAEPAEVYARALATSGRLAEAIRDNLTEGARRLGLSPDQTRLGVDQEDAIDLVAMVFEALFRNHSLQDRARHLYARLVLPYVKVALHDDAMFVHPEHPARRLLDAITEACEGNDAANAQDRELFERVAAVSQRVAAEFNEDLAVFELAHAELEELLQQQRRRVELQADRAAKATYGRERLVDARTQADHAVQRRLAARPLTQAVADFLSTRWRHYMVQTLLRDGADSARHAEATRLGDTLVEADRLAETGRGHDLADCLIALEPAIVQCLATSGLDDSAARHGMAWLVGALADPASPRQLHVLASRSVDEGGRDDPHLWLAGGTDTVPHDPDVAALMRRLQPGEWLRMVDPQHAATAVKVAWISPLTSRLLLVNRRGLRVLAASAEELAGLVGAGRLMVGGENAPFAEAMRQLRHRLDQAVGQR